MACTESKCKDCKCETHNKGKPSSCCNCGSHNIDFWYDEDQDSFDDEDTLIEDISEEE